ncbi:MAG: hypothetical protein ACJ8DI_25625 [Ktedonobacteraceae bacterium]
MQKVRILFSAFAIVLALLLTTACGGSLQSASSSPSPTATSTPSPTPTPTPRPHVAHAGQSVDQLLQGLKAHGLPISVSFTYNAANDLNHQLGRPGQYIGKVNFKDMRISSSEQGAAILVANGGSIEVFENPTDAKHRFTYLQALSKSGVPQFVEYEYLDGVVVLRVSNLLTPDQAKQYLTALKALS